MWVGKIMLIIIFQISFVRFSASKNNRGFKVEKWETNKIISLILHGISYFGN